MKHLLSLLPRLSPTAARRVVLVLMAFTAMVCLGCSYGNDGDVTSGGGVSRGPMTPADFFGGKITIIPEGSSSRKTCPCCGAERDSEGSAEHAVLDCGQHCRAQVLDRQEKYHTPCQYCRNCAAEGQHGDGVCNTQPLIATWWIEGGSLLDDPDTCPSCGEPVGEGHYVTEPDHGGYTREEQAKTTPNNYYDCNQCDFNTYNQAEVVVHQTANPGRVAHVCEEVSHTSKKTKYGFQCPYEGCGFTCTTEEEKLAHLDSLDSLSHVVSAEGQYRCPGEACTAAGLTFPSKVELEAHYESSPACFGMTFDGVTSWCNNASCVNTTPNTYYGNDIFTHAATHGLSSTGTVSGENSYYCSCGEFADTKTSQTAVQEHLDKMDAHRSAFAEVQQTAIATSSSTTYTYDCDRCDFTTTDPDEAEAHEEANGYLPAHVCAALATETTETITVYPCNDTACANHSAPPADLMAALEHHAANDGSTYCKDSPPDYQALAQLMQLALNGESGTIITPAGQAALDAQLRPGEHAETKVKDLFTATPVGDDPTPFTPTEPGTVVGAAEVTINAVDENGNARPLTIASGNDRAFGHTVPLHLPADVDPRYVKAYRVEGAADDTAVESSTSGKKKVKVVSVVGAGMRYEMSPEVFAELEYNYEFKTRDTTVTGAGYQHKRAEDNENRMRLGVNVDFSGTAWSDGNSLYIFVYEPPVEEEEGLSGGLIAAIVGVAVLAVTGGVVCLARRKKSTDS